MRLPYPAVVNGVVYDECEIQQPTTNTIMETKKIAQEGAYFTAHRPFAAGCITSMSGTNGQDIVVVDDPVALKGLIPRIPYKTIEYIALMAVLHHYSDDDGIEGIYPCPRCGFESIAEERQIGDTVIDLRDHVKDLKVNYFEGDPQGRLIHVDLEIPVVVKDKRTDELILQVDSMDLRMPVLADCISAEGKVGSRDPVKLQLAIYVEALEKVNGEPIDNKFKNEWGMYVFGNIRAIKHDLGVLSDEITRWGLDTTVEKTCAKCGRKWRPHVSTSNFFVSVPLS